MCLYPIFPATFSRTMTASSRWMIGVHTPMRSLLVRCTTSLAAALTLASFGIHFLCADNDPEISHQAMKLNQRGLSHLQKKEYDQAIASFREALQIQPEYPDALDNLGKALDATGKDAEAIADFDRAKALNGEVIVIFLRRLDESKNAPVRIVPARGIHGRRLRVRRRGTTQPQNCEAARSGGTNPARNSRKMSNRRDAMDASPQANFIGISILTSRLTDTDTRPRQ
jgi:tetratricopeptide (TPR) repeat protein